MTPFFGTGYLPPSTPTPAGPLAPSRLDELKKRFEENPRRFFAPLANEYRKAGDLDQAIALCQEYLADQAGNMNGHVVYGQALFDAGRYDEAQTTFTTALALDPENLIALRHLGDIARLNGNATVALDWYKRVLEADPRNDEILGFIEELKAMPAPAAPTPARSATPIAPAEAVPPARTTVPTPAPIESAATARSAPTPIAPIEPIEPIAPPPAPRVSEPKKRPSISLIDVDFDSGMDAQAPEVAAPPPPAPEAPLEPAGDIELGTIDFGDPAAAPTEAAAPAAEPAAVPSGDIELDSGLSWDMGGNVDLPSGDTASAASDAPPAGDTPQVFVTETMAELYLQQGFRDEALNVYRQLAAANPDDESLRERVRSLEEGGRASLSLDKVSDVEIDMAPGVDSIVPMSSAAPEPAPMEIDLDVPPSEAPTPTVPIETLDFDSTPPAVASVAAVAPEPEPLQIDEPVAAATPELIPEPAPAPRAPTPRAPTPAIAARGASAGQSARGFFAALAQRRALRPDGTLPKGMPAIARAATPVAATVGGGSIDGLFGSSTPAEADDAMGQALATALGQVDTGASIRGRPTQAAASELSLDSVFRKESPMRTSGPVQRQSQVLKFDQFFASGAPAEDAAEGPAAPATPDVPAPTDDAQFQSWLQGLKGQ